MPTVYQAEELTEIELFIIRSLAEGKTLRQIARDLHMTNDTLKHRVFKLRKAWKCATNCALVAEAYERDILWRTPNTDRVKNLLMALDVAYRNARMLGGYR